MGDLYCITIICNVTLYCIHRNFCGMKFSLSHKQIGFAIVFSRIIYLQILYRLCISVLPHTSTKEIYVVMFQEQKAKCFAYLHKHCSTENREQALSKLRLQFQVHNPVEIQVFLKNCGRPYLCHYTLRHRANSWNCMTDNWMRPTAMLSLCRATM